MMEKLTRHKGEKPNYIPGILQVSGLLTTLS